MEPAASKEILQDRYLLKLYTHQRISFVICYITFKTRISFKEHMKRGAHLLAPGPAGVEGRFVKEIMLLLDGISVWGTKHKREKRFHHCNVCDKAFKSLQMPSQHKVWQHSGHVFACKGCCKNFNCNNSINRHNRLVCGKPHHRKSFCHFSMWGKDHYWGDHPQSEHVGGRRRGRGLFWPAPGRRQTSSTLSNGNLLC